MSQPPETFNATHRALLQILLSRGTLTFPEAQPILASLLTAHDSSSDSDRTTLPNDIRPADFESYIHTLNAAIAEQDFEIRSAVPLVYAQSGGSAGVRNDAGRGERVYALVNTTSDPVTQMATVHKPEEIAFVKRVLDEIFDTNNTATREVMAVTGMQALAVSRAGGRTSDINGHVNGDAAGGSTGGLTKTQAESMLRNLVEEGWFVKMKDFYVLSSRALLELRDWLRETYNEPAEEEDEVPVERIKSCAACREIVTIGQRCQRRSCKARVHEHCLGSYFRTQGGRQKCGVCGEDWTGEHFVGPKAAKAKDKRSTNGPAALRARDAEETNGVDEDEEPQTSRGSSDSRRQSKGMTDGVSRRPQPSGIPPSTSDGLPRGSQMFGSTLVQDLDSEDD